MESLSMEEGSESSTRMPLLEMTAEDGAEDGAETGAGIARAGFRTEDFEKRIIES